jgi:hypothetical protein
VAAGFNQLLLHYRQLLHTQLLTFPICLRHDVTRTNTQSKLELHPCEESEVLQFLERVTYGAISSLKAPLATRRI